jgi:hypothetical protein
VWFFEIYNFIFKGRCGKIGLDLIDFWGKTESIEENALSSLGNEKTA